MKVNLVARGITRPVLIQTARGEGMPAPDADMPSSSVADSTHDVPAMRDAFGAIDGFVVASTYPRGDTLTGEPVDVAANRSSGGGS